MNFIESLLTCYKKTFNYSGRASKSEFWWFQLYAIIIYGMMFVFQGDLVLVFSILVIANIIPVYAAAVRRLHDTDKSGWMVLISVIPLIGLYIIVLLITDGTKGKNRFGPKPKK